MMPRVSVLLLVLVLALAPGCRKSAPPALVPASVVVAPASKSDVPLIVQATGTVEPIQSVSVEAQVAGMLERVLFREGDDVREGQVLFEIDPHLYASAYAQAQATLTRDLAQTANAERDRQRFEDLAVKEFVTAQQVDQARTTAVGLVATLRADSAALNRSRIDLERAAVRAPISGRAGALLVREGNLVRTTAGQPLVQINQLAPILVRFAVPATELSGIRRAGPGLAALASPVGDTTAADSGVLVFIDNAVDSMTGTILLKARFPNARRTLWPGGLVRVLLTVGVDRGATVVPLSAVLIGQQGAAVFVLTDSATVQLRPVTVGRTTDSLAILHAGVRAGERIVVSGQVRLTDGAQVKVIGADSSAAAP
ncbi:MAG: efflux RND transporter periplasmic adaptor subunit [Gemmatimonadales bacterium]